MVDLFITSEGGFGGECRSNFIRWEGSEGGCHLRGGYDEGTRSSYLEKDGTSVLPLGWMAGDDGGSPPLARASQTRPLHELDAPQGLAAAGDGGALRADGAGMRGLADGSGSGRRSSSPAFDPSAARRCRPVCSMLDRHRQDVHGAPHAWASQGRGDTTDCMRDMRRLSLGRQFLYQESYTISKLS